MAESDLVTVLPLVIAAIALACLLPFLFAYKTIYAVPTPILWMLMAAILPLGCAFIVVSVSQIVPGL